MPTNAVKTGRFGTGGPWGTGLLLLGVFSLIYGVASVLRPESTVPSAVIVLSVWIPMWIWACLWVAAGLYSVMTALNPPQSHRDISPVAAMAQVWAIAFFINWLAMGIEGDWTTEWLSASVWQILAAFILVMGRTVNPPRSR